MMLFLPSAVNAKEIAKAIRKVDHPPREMEQAAEIAGIPWETHERWMRVGDLMYMAPTTETANFVGDHVKRRRCVDYYATVRMALSKYTKCPPAVMAPQVFFSSSVHGEFLHYLDAGHLLEDACGLVGITRAIFWNWFRRGRTGQERFLSFYGDCREKFISAYGLGTGE